MRELPDGWDCKKLADVAIFQNGRAFKPEEWGNAGREIIRIQNLTGSTDEVNYYDGPVDEKHLVRKGDVLISWSGSLGVYIWDGEEAALNQHIFKVKLRSSLVNREYFVYAVKTVIDEMKRFTHGSTMKHIVKSDFDNTLIPVPPLDTQRKIVAILDKAEGATRLRARANELTQKLLQSVFLEMFGDPVENPMGWGIESLGNLVLDKKSISCGPFGSQLKIGEYVDSGVPVLGIDNVDKDRFVWAKPKYVTKEKAEQLTEFVTKPGDILITRTGTVGRACIVPDTVTGAIIGPNLLRIRLDRTKLIPEFFSVSLNYMPSMMEQVMRMSPGATVAVLNTTNLRALRIAVPPTDYQKKFALLSKEIKSMNNNQEASEKASSSLFEALMLKAFTGELVA